MYLKKNQLDKKVFLIFYLKCYIQKIDTCANNAIQSPKYHLVIIHRSFKNYRFYFTGNWFDHKRKNLLLIKNN